MHPNGAKAGAPQPARWHDVAAKAAEHRQASKYGQQDERPQHPQAPLVWRRAGHGRWRRRSRAKSCGHGRGASDEGKTRTGTAGSPRNRRTSGAGYWGSAMRLSSSLSDPVHATLGVELGRHRLGRRVEGEALPAGLLVTATSRLLPSAKVTRRVCGAITLLRRTTTTVSYGNGPGRASASGCLLPSRRA